MCLDPFPLTVPKFFDSNDKYKMVINSSAGARCGKNFMDSWNKLGWAGPSSAPTGLKKNLLGYDKGPFCCSLDSLLPSEFKTLHHKHFAVNELYSNFTLK